MYIFTARYIRYSIISMNLLNYTIWALASALAPSGKESPRENENPVFYLIKKYHS